MFEMKMQEMQKARFKLGQLGLLKGLHEPLVCKHLDLKALQIQMHTPTRTYMVVIKDFDHMTTMDDKVNCMKPTHLLSKTFSKP